ncbi:Hypothetical predicted protein [Paramuricea clavata]|uniref:Uncharacterized protein n=1 Tax=Paramuricea clavata TaxID=317549 RepID=A0A7D9HGV8_PARCT|nr:Hypothetical predicted protein [Paramuricea clavata]
MSTKKLPRFSGMSFWFVPKKLVRAQKQILAKKITERGGIVLADYVPETTHVLVPRGISLEDAQKAMKTKDHKPRHLKIVRIDWLPKCIQTCSIVPLLSFEMASHSEATDAQNYEFELSGTSKLPHATKVVDWVKHEDGYGFNLSTEELHLPVIVKAVPIPELQINGIGVFFQFSDDGKLVGFQINIRKK